jgi:hypothetical protein
MDTAKSLIKHAIEIIAQNIIRALDPRADLIAEIERLTHEKEAEQGRADMWAKRSSKLLVESNTLDIKCRWLERENVYLRAVVMHDSEVYAGSMLVEVTLDGESFNVGESETRP